MAVRPTTLSTFAAAALAGLALVAPVSAAPLTAEACRALEDEQGKLEQQGTRTDMIKGPAWSKTNLTKERLESVRRLIEIDESLNFRCPGRKPLVALGVDTPEEPQPDDPAAAVKGQQPPAKAPVPADAKAPVKRVVKPKAPPQAPAADPPAATTSSGEASPSPPRKRTQPAPVKPKPEPGASPATVTQAGTTAPPAKARSRPKPNDAYIPPPKVDTVP